MEDTSSLAFIHEIEFAFCDTDLMKIVHHAAYFRYFENARLALLREGFADYMDIEKEYGLQVPVIGTQVKYLKSSYFGEKYKIEVYSKTNGKASFSIFYRLYQGEQTNCLARTDHVFTDFNQKIKRLPGPIFNLSETQNEPEWIRGLL